MKEKRKEQARKRKNFLPTLLLTLLLWVLLAFIIYFFDPQTPGIIIVFFAVLFMVFLFTFSIIFGNSRRGLLASVASTIFAILSYFGVGNILNLLLIAGFFTTVEVYFSKK